MDIFELTDYIRDSIGAETLADKQVQKEILEADADMGANHICAMIDHLGIYLLNEALKKKGYALDINRG